MIMVYSKNKELIKHVRKFAIIDIMVIINNGFDVYILMVLNFVVNRLNTDCEVAQSIMCINKVIHIHASHLGKNEKTLILSPSWCLIHIYKSPR